MCECVASDYEAAMQARRGARAPCLQLQKFRDERRERGVAAQCRVKAGYEVLR